MKLFSNIFLGLAALSAVVYANENGYGCSKKHDGESKCTGKRLPTGHVAVKTCYHRMWRVKACKLGCYEFPVPHCRTSWNEEHWGPDGSPNNGTW